MEEPGNVECGSVYTQKGPGRCLDVFGDCPLTTMTLNKSLDKTTSPVARLCILLLHFFDCTGRNFGQMCFANNPITGVTMLLGIAIAMPLVALSSFLASTVAIATSLIFKLSSGQISAGLTGYNSTLFAAVFSALLLVPESTLANQPAFWLAIVIGSVLCVAVASSLTNSLGSLKPSIPIFSIPFNLITTFLLLAMRVHEPSEVQASLSPPDVPEFCWKQTLLGSLLGVGQVVGVQDWRSSALVLLGMTACSPLLTLAGYSGSLVTTTFAVYVSPALYEAAYAGLWGYNGFLSACAVCFFYVPTWRSLLLAAINCLLAAIIHVALAFVFAGLQVPVLSIPFVMSSALLFGLSTTVLPRPQTGFTYPEKHRLLWRKNVCKAV